MTNRAIWGAGLGVGFTWTSVFGTEINSLAAGSIALSTNTVTNQTALDIYTDFSINLSGTVTAGQNAFIGIWLLPLNGDGTTYGDGVVAAGGSSATLPAAVPYMVGSIGLNHTVAPGALTGTRYGIVMPPGTFRWGISNGTGNALAASAGSAYYRTYIENLNG